MNWLAAAPLFLTNLHPGPTRSYCVIRWQLPCLTIDRTLLFCLVYYSYILGFLPHLRVLKRLLLVPCLAGLAMWRINQDPLFKPCPFPAFTALAAAQPLPYPLSF